MDARVALAIIAVIRQARAAERSPVAFLRNPEGVTAERFKALSGFDGTVEGNSALFRLAWLVNGRIDLPYMQDSMSVPLWSLVDDILNRSGIRGRAKLEGDEAAYREARAILYVEDGTAQARPSEANLTYWRMRDEWFCRRQDLSSRTLERELLPRDDPRRPALDVVIARLTDELEDFERRWEEEGARSRIESAAETVDMIAARTPGRRWDQWQDTLAQFLDLGAETDILSQGRFAATAIVPSGIERSPESWSGLSIGGAAVDRLVAALPAELSAPLNPEGGALNLESLSFEWTTAGIVRPWLDSALFASRSWRFGDAARMVSDGAADPDGECPYIASGLVLVKMSGRRSSPRRSRPRRRPRRPVTPGSSPAHCSPTPS